MGPSPADKSASSLFHPYMPSEATYRCWINGGMKSENGLKQAIVKNPLNIA
jgi:hypothetical protein